MNHNVVLSLKILMSSEDFQGNLLSRVKTMKIQTLRLPEKGMYDIIYIKYIIWRFNKWFHRY
jgi:hypothetical protein